MANALVTDRRGCGACAKRQPAEVAIWTIGCVSELDFRLVEGESGVTVNEGCSARGQPGAVGTGLVPILRSAGFAPSAFLPDCRVPQIG
jgi:hypothetical protein